MGSPKKNRFHDPLLPEDSETRTVGCRHTNADICKKYQLDSVCAFVRQDGMCTAPPSTWAKQYRRLKVLGSGTS